MIIADAVILLVAGASMLITGGYGRRLSSDQHVFRYVSVREATLRRRMLRGGVYACMASGSLLVLTAIVLISVVIIK